MEFDAHFWALIALILFFVLIIYMGVHRSVAGLLDKRADAIRDELENARRLRVEAEALLAEYQRKARDAEAEAGKIVETAKREAAGLAAEAKAKLEEYVVGRTKLAEDKIAQAESQAIQEVRALSADVAISAAERLLSSKVKGAAGDALVAKSISDVKTRLN
jgi:F-type H+-transporting ATPase subunit b